MENKRSPSPLSLDESLSSPSLPGFHPHLPRTVLYRFASTRRRLAIATGSILSILSLLILAYLSFSPSFTRSPTLVLQDNISPVTPLWERKAALLGPPTNRFRGTSSSH